VLFYDVTEEVLMQRC
jgi:adenylate kinase family enzyme